jgi:hypothetical protein
MQAGLIWIAVAIVGGGRMIAAAIESLRKTIQFENNRLIERLCEFAFETDRLDHPITQKSHPDGLTGRIETPLRAKD